MWSQALSLFKSDSSPSRNTSLNQGNAVRPALEELERRELLSGNPLGNLFGQTATGVLPINFSYVTSTASPGTQGAQFNAQGMIGANPISVPLTLTSTQVNPHTNILSLHLAPIDLNLLGLEVKTSEICLNITAQQGPGNLLGNLLSDVAHALDHGGSLNSLNPFEQLLLPYELASVLNAGVNQVTAASNLQNAASTTNILHLSLGPVNLDLLGLDVMLNNCANPAGPVTVDVNAIQGNGDLLGNLLGGLANSLNPTGSANPTFANLVGDVLQLI